MKELKKMDDRIDFINGDLNYLPLFENYLMVNKVERNFHLKPKGHMNC
jgi:hypothetical protein